MMAIQYLEAVCIGPPLSHAISRLFISRSPNRWISTYSRAICPRPPFPLYQSINGLFTTRGPKHQLCQGCIERTTPLPLETCCLFTLQRSKTLATSSLFVKDRLSPMLQDVCVQYYQRPKTLARLYRRTPPPPWETCVACIQLEAQSTGYLEAVCVAPPYLPWETCCLFTTRGQKHWLFRGCLCGTPPSPSHGRPVACLQLESQALAI